MFVGVIYFVVLTGYAIYWIASSGDKEIVAFRNDCISRHASKYDCRMTDIEAEEITIICENELAEFVRLRRERKEGYGSIDPP